MTYNSVVREEKNESPECVQRPSSLSHSSSHRHWTHHYCQHQSSWWVTIITIRAKQKYSGLMVSIQHHGFPFFFFFFNASILLILLSHNSKYCTVVFCMYTLYYILYNIVYFAHIYTYILPCRSIYTNLHILYSIFNLRNSQELLGENIIITLLFDFTTQPLHKPQPTII